MVAGGVEFVQVGEDDNVALHALELEDGKGPEAALLVLLRGIVRHGLDTTELGGNGAGLLPCLAHTQDDNILSEMRGQNMLRHDDVKQLEFPACQVRGADDRGTLDTRGLDVGSADELGRSPADLVGIPLFISAPASNICRSSKSTARGRIDWLGAKLLVQVLKPAPAPPGMLSS